MPANDFPGAKKRDRLTASNINRWIAGAHRSTDRRLDAMLPQGGDALQDLAVKMACVNKGSTDIPAGAPVSIEALAIPTEDGLLNHRWFNVVLLENATTRQVHAGVAVNAIPYNSGGGEVYVDGVCVAQLTDANAGLVAAAGLEVLWDSATSGTRYALVRFGGTNNDQFVQIIGGQTLTTGQTGITYSASLSLSQVYDPDVDTTYPAGLGNAWLWVNGVRQASRVLVVHDDSDFQTPFLPARRRVLGTVTLTVASGPSTGQTMTAYRTTWE